MMSDLWPFYTSFAAAGGFLVGTAVGHGDSCSAGEALLGATILFFVVALIALWHDSPTAVAVIHG